jgi:hypothetical protein
MKEKIKSNLIAKKLSRTSFPHDDVRVTDGLPACCTMKTSGCMPAVKEGSASVFRNEVRRAWMKSVFRK